jgi:integrase
VVAIARPGRQSLGTRPDAPTRPPDQARADTSLEWVTPHTFRKTVATLIDKEADTDRAAAQLGHGSKEITKKHYIDKPALAPDSSDILEQLGASQPTTDREPRDRGPRPAP